MPLTTTTTGLRTTYHDDDAARAMLGDASRWKIFAERNCGDHGERLACSRGNRRPHCCSYSENACPQTAVDVADTNCCTAAWTLSTCPTMDPKSGDVMDRVESMACALQIVLHDNLLVRHNQGFVLFDAFLIMIRERAAPRSRSSTFRWIARKLRHAQYINEQLFVRALLCRQKYVCKLDSSIHPTGR